VVKILDWGLASLRPPASRRPAAATEPKEDLVGTADYIAPEQATNPAGANIRADVYSLGCTLYFLLAGQVPFPGGSLMQKLLKHQRSEPAPVTQLRPEVPAGLAGVVQRMLAKRPEDRYQTPAAMATALAPFCRAEDVGLGPAGRAARRSRPPTPTWGCPTSPSRGPRSATRVASTCRAAG
jgi:serine/threonine-protein kinase